MNKSFKFMSLMFVVFWLVGAVAAQAEDVETTWARTPPTIDGDIGFDEWAGALKISVDGSEDYDLYLMSDDQYLYGAVDLLTDSNLVTNDQIGIYFDNNNDGSYPATCGAEGNYWIAKGVSGWNLTHQPRIVSGSCAQRTPTELTAITEMHGHLMYEFRIDLTGGLGMSGGPGGTIGFGVYASDYDETSRTWWPWNGDFEDPSTWNNLTFAEEPSQLDLGYANLPPNIDGEISDGEWDEATVIHVDDGFGFIEYYAYYMTDGYLLYGAIDAVSDTVLEDMDYIYVAFDNDLNGNWPGSCDDEGNYFIEYFSTGFENIFRPFNWSGTTYGVCSNASTDAIHAEATLNGGNVQFEFIISLEYDEMYGALDETTGFYMFYHDEAASDAYTLEWPEEGIWHAPYTYAFMNYPTYQWPQYDANWTDNPPTIDGSIDAGEWDDALLIPVYAEGSYNILEYNTYTMADGDYLYVAFDVLDDTTLSSTDVVGLYFDNENDNVWGSTCAETTEGRYAVSYNGVDLDLRFDPAGSDGTPWCGQVEATTVEAEVGVSTKGNVQFELRIDINGGEMYGAQGETIGVRYYAWDFDSTFQGRFPIGSVFIDPSTYADMTYPSCDGCWVEGECWADGTVNPSNECQWCDAGTADDAWSDHDGIACTDDGLFCSGDEVCDAGVCISEGDPCTDDGLFCTGVESCDEVADECLASGDPCEEDETCMEETDECVPNADDDTADDDTADDDTTDDDTADDDTADDDDDDNDDITPPDDDDDDNDTDTGDGITGGDDDDDSGCGC